MHQLRWLDDLGNENVQSFHTEEEALEAAGSMKGPVLVTPMGGGPPSVFRDGHELRGEDASDVVVKWGHRLEVGISRPEKPDTDSDPDDLTGSGWSAGFPAQWGWRVWKGSAGSTDWVGTFQSREDARRAVEQVQMDDPDLAGLPIVDIGPTGIR
jgi:hypothetical protein